MKFYCGIHHPRDAARVAAACVSVKALKNRQGGFPVRDWIMDSGAFTTISTQGGYGPDDLWLYQLNIENCFAEGNLEAAVSQDYMCEPAMLERTGLTIADHQRLTIERFDELRARMARSAVRCCDKRAADVYIMPVLQGYELGDYVSHLAQYGQRLAAGAWLGVGSVCKRNRRPEEIAAVFAAIKAVRPDLRLHGFGVKLTALQSPAVRELLHSADSMAWSFSARKQGRDPNCWREAVAFADRVNQVAQ